MIAAWLFRIGRRCRKRGRDTLTDTPFLASRQFGPGGIPQQHPRLLNRSLLRLSGLESVDFLSQPGHLRRELLDAPLDGDELLVLLPVSQPSSWTTRHPWKAKYVRTIP